MIESIFKKPWFKPAWHLILIISFLYSGFFLLEGWKINRKNILLVENNLALSQSIEELKNQNSFVNLDSFRDKAVKGSGYKYPGEQVIDTSRIDTFNENDNTKLSKIKLNHEKWVSCLTGKNEKIFESVITSCR
jgi:hypothetical protein